jgi:predicted metal-dependent hydrolase
MKSHLYPVQELRRKTQAWAIKLKVNPRAIRVQEMRHKWGSCSSAGTVTFATDLAEKDAVFQDYVIVHELLHLRYATHGKVFKAILTAHVPGWKKFSDDSQKSSVDRIATFG